jgi:tRNA A37 threonylcarbamoyladenosine synthetase subunit TsaC/SUA5/YrdC
VELILDPNEDQPKVLTTVVDLTQGEPVLVRQGLGVFIS